MLVYRAMHLTLRLLLLCSPFCVANPFFRGMLHSIYLNHESPSVFQSSGFPEYYPPNKQQRWIIEGPTLDSRVTLTFTEFDIPERSPLTRDCLDVVFIQQAVRDIEKLCGTEGLNRTFTSMSNKLVIELHSIKGSERKKGFRANFSISNADFTPNITRAITTTKRPCTEEEFACLINKDCIPLSAVCNGIDDCGSLQDENCWKAPWSLLNQESTLYRATTYLYKQVKDDWDLKEQPHIVIIGLALRSSNLVGFGSNTNAFTKEAVISQHLEVQLLSSMLKKDAIKTGQLGLYVLALHAVCLDAGNFYNFDLAARLNRQDYTDEQVNPVIALAYCVTYREIPSRYVKHLEQYLMLNSSIPTNLDLQASSIIALACVLRKELTIPENVSRLIVTTVEHFKTLQKKDGSFGNVATSALIGQALNALKDDGRGWDYFKLIYFLKRQQSADGKFQDVATTSLVIPVISGRSLVDIMDLNCVDEIRRRSMFSNATEVSYSVWVGEKKDISYKIRLTYPKDDIITVIDLVRTASGLDSKFKAMWEIRDHGFFIYSINGIYNSPLEQKYWRVFEISNGLKSYNQSLDEIYAHDSQHFVMWLT